MATSLPARYHLVFSPWQPDAHMMTRSRKKDVKLEQRQSSDNTDNGGGYSPCTLPVWIPVFFALLWLISPRKLPGRKKTGKTPGERVGDGEECVERLDESLKHQC
jgi:hypothetical protein